MEDEERSPRKRIVDKLIEIMLEVAKPIPQPHSLMWDDCDMEDRQFWCYFNVKMYGVLPKSDERRMIAAQFRRMQTAARAHVNKNTDYDMYWQVLEYPRLLCASPLHRSQSTNMCHYDKDLWLFKITLTGGT